MILKFVSRELLGIGNPYVENFVVQKMAVLLYSGSEEDGSETGEALASLEVTRMNRDTCESVFEACDAESGELLEVYSALMEMDDDELDRWSSKISKFLDLDYDEMMGSVLYLAGVNVNTLSPKVRAWMVWQTLHMFGNGAAVVVAPKDIVDGIPDFVPAPEPVWKDSPMYVLKTEWSLQTWLTEHMPPPIES